MIRMQDTRRRNSKVKKPFNWFMMVGVAMDQAHVIQTEGAQAVLQKFYCGKNPECKLPF